MKVIKRTYLPNPHTRCTKNETERAKTIIKLPHIVFPVKKKMIDLRTTQNLWTILEIVHKYDKWTS